MTESSLNQLCQRVESSSAFLVEHVGQLIKFIQQLSALESCEKADGKGGQHPLLPCTLAAQPDALLCLQARIHLKAMDLLDDLTIFTNELNRLAQQFEHFGQPSAEEHCLKICQPIGYPYMENDLLAVTDYLKQLVSMLEQKIHRSNEALGFGTEPLAALPKSVEQWLGQRLLVFSSGTGNNNKVPSGVKLPWAVHKALYQLKLHQQQQQQKQKTFEDI